MAKEPRKDEIDAAAAPSKPAKTTKRRRAAATAAPAGMCDDIICNILVRLPARTLVASMVLSKHHRRMILCPEFINLHLSLGPPLPPPHIAYIATAKIKGSCGQYLVSGFHGFHVAGAGAGHSGNTAPMRSLTGPLCLYMRHGACVLWNPAVADGEKQVTVPVSASDNCVVLGLGYGRRSQTYKLLVSRRGRLDMSALSGWYGKDLLAYTLLQGAGGKQQQQQLRTVLGEDTFFRRGDGEIFNKSLYLDGTVYLLCLSKRMVLAFNVDDETIATISLPKGHVNGHSLEISRLMEISDRPCVETDDYSCRTLWLLTVDHQWEPRCVIRWDSNRDHQREFDRSSIAGAWDCGGVMPLYMQRSVLSDHHNKLYLFDPSTQKMYKANLPWNLMSELSCYAFCWGYKPTLVSPGSIVGAQDDQERCRGHDKDIMEILEPLNQHEKKKWGKATAATVCFMNFLVCIMRKLPEHTQDVIEMAMLNSDPYLLFKNAIEFVPRKQ